MAYSGDEHDDIGVRDQVEHLRGRADRRRVDDDLVGDLGEVVDAVAQDADHFVGSALEAGHVDDLDPIVAGGADEVPDVDDPKVLGLERRIRRGMARQGLRELRSAEVAVGSDGALTRLAQSGREIRRHRGLAVAGAGRDDERDVAAGLRRQTGLDEGDEVAQSAVGVGQRTVLVGPHHNSADRTTHLRNGDTRAHADDLLGLVPRADLAVEASEQDGDQHTDDGARDHAHQCPARAGRRRAQTAVDLRNRLGALERGEREPRCVRLEVPVLFECQPVLHRHRVTLGRDESVLRVGSCLLAEVGEFGLEGVDALAGRRSALFVCRILAFGQVRAGLLGEGVRDRLGLGGGLLLRPEGESPGIEVVVDSDLLRELGRAALVAEPVGDALRHVADRGEQLDLARCDARCVSGTRQHRVRGAERGRGLLHLGGLGNRAEDRAEHGEDDDEPPAAAQRLERSGRLHDRSVSGWRRRRIPTCEGYRSDRRIASHAWGRR